MQTIADERQASTVGIGDLLAALARSTDRDGSQIAVSAPDGTVTFADLTDQVARLSQALRAHGVTPASPVALNCGRSWLAPAALLAVWAVGATAVPLDTRHPADRLNFMLRDSGATLLLGDRLPAGAATSRLTRLDPNQLPADRQPVGQPVGPSDPDDCAYLIYTSGTTGWPKGVEVSYRNLQAFCDALGELDAPVGGIGINAVSPAFDGWLWCTLLYLRFGQQLHIVDLADGRPTGLTERLVAVQPRVVCLTPSLLASCTDPLPSAELIVVAGEPCPPGLVDRFGHSRRMLNVYGPTETTIAATWADSARGDDPRTIGRPLPGYLGYLLDPDGRPVADGEAGELYIGGPAVARGYRNQPQLTGERFLPDPFAGSGRMYRTGDQARRRPDGQLEYLGRVDEQVKVHGYRIELGGIDRIAAEVPGVRTAASFVLAGGHALGLAVVPADGAAPRDCITEIRRRCQRLLPEQQVPALIRAVESVPVTPSGKLDRDALATAALGWQEPTGRPPSGPRELQVCTAFERLLGRPVTDADANFFELGGHSLLAARVINELRAATGLAASMRSLLANPTVAGLAAELDRLAEQPTASTESTR